MYTNITPAGELKTAQCSTQRVEGFRKIVAFVRNARMAALFRPADSCPTWWAYPSADGNQAVAWESAVVPREYRRGRVTFVWSCILGGGKASYPHDLYVNDRLVGRIHTPCTVSRAWRWPAAELYFDCLEVTGNRETHGIMYLTVPAAAVVPGQPVRLKVAGGKTSLPNFSFYMLLGYADTLAHAEHLAWDGAELVRHGKPRATIVVSRSAGEVERFAAAELQRYLAQISGARLPLRSRAGKAPGNLVLIGAAGALARGVRLPAAQADRDTILVKTVPGRLILAGSNPRSTLFAVYQFLMSLGCRWIEPGTRGEVIPRRADIRSGVLDLVSAAAFSIRSSRPTEDLYIYSARDVRDQIDWMAKNGLNWFQFLFPPYERLRAVIVPEMRKRGMGIGVGDHNFRTWVPRPLFDKHPDYFAMLNGRRIPAGTVRCASSAAGLKVWERNAVAWTAAHPEVDTIAISCDDGMDYCQCPACRNLRPIEQLQIFYNRAARAIHRRFPGKKICVAAYGGHYEPARNVPIYRRNVLVMYDTFARCQAHPLLTTGCSRPHQEILYSYSTPDVRTREGNRYLCLTLKQWRKVLGQVTIFENVMLHMRNSTPFPYPHILAADLRYYKDTGITGFWPQADLPRWVSAAVNHYVISRLLWDPEVRLETVLADYYRQAFSSAAEPMQRYEALLEEALREGHAGIVLAVLTPALIRRCATLLKQAAAQADTPAAKAAVRRAGILFEYTRLIWQLTALHDAAWKQIRAGHWPGARRTRAEAIRTARALAALAGRHKHDNIILYTSDSMQAVFDQAVNDYPAAVARRKIDVTPWLAGAYSLMTVEGVTQSWQARERYHRQ